MKTGQIIKSRVYKENFSNRWRKGTDGTLFEKRNGIGGYYVSGSIIDMLMRKMIHFNQNDPQRIHHFDKSSQFCTDDWSYGTVGWA